MRTILSVCLALMGCCLVSARAQDADVLPERLLQLEGQLGVIDDLHVSETGSSSSFSITNENGVKTTRVVDGTTRMAIVEDPASGITCAVTRTYGPNDLAKLEEEQPELFMHLSSIPKNVGESQIEISVGVTSTYSAADPDELKSKHPDVYKLFRKYTQEQGFGRMQIRLGHPLQLRLGERNGRLLRAFGDEGKKADDEGDDDGDDEMSADDDDGDEADSDDDGDDDGDDDSDDDGDDDGR